MGQRPSDTPRCGIPDVKHEQCVFPCSSLSSSATLMTASMLCSKTIHQAVLLRSEGRCTSSSCCTNPGSRESICRRSLPLIHNGRWSSVSHATPAVSANTQSGIAPAQPVHEIYDSLIATALDHHYITKLGRHHAFTCRIWVCAWCTTLCWQLANCGDAAAAVAAAAAVGA